MGKKFDYTKIPPWLRREADITMQGFYEKGWSISEICNYICTNPEYKMLFEHTKRAPKKLAKYLQNTGAGGKYRKS